MTYYVTALLVSGLIGASLPGASNALDGVLRDLAAGKRPLDGVRLETQCLDEGQFVYAAAHGNGVAIWKGERQGTLNPDQVLALVKAFDREGFARMPDSFGGDERKPRRMAVKMTCRVRFAAGDIAKDVIQLDKGEQSLALKRLARGILDAARNGTRDAARIESLHEGLAAVADGRLAVETLRITLRAGGTRARHAGGWVLRVDGRNVEVEPDAGATAKRRLEESAVRDLARALTGSSFATLPVNVSAPEHVDVTVAVLGHEHAVQAREFSGRPPEPRIHERFEQAVAPLIALRTIR